MRADDKTIEATLAPLFAAARAEPSSPPLSLLSAILADAAEVGAARQPSPPERRRERSAGVATFAGVLGGWRGLAALGASAAVGLWIGFSADLTVDGTSVQTGSAVASALDPDPVEDFFDLASLE